MVGLRAAALVWQEGGAHQGHQLHVSLLNRHGCLQAVQAPGLAHEASVPPQGGLAFRGPARYRSFPMFLRSRRRHAGDPGCTLTPSLCVVLL